MHQGWKLIERAQSSPVKRWLLELFYPVPEPLRSDEEWRRSCHEDLGGLTQAELKLERRRVEWRLDFDDSNHDAGVR